MGRECIIGDGCKFKFDAFFNGQPVKLTNKVCGGEVWMVPEDNAGNRVLDLLQLGQVEFSYAIENIIAIIEAGLNKGNCDYSGSVVSEGVEHMTKSI